MDVQEIDGASNRGIDEIRELRENIKYMPSSSRYRIYIIDEVHMLTLPAFNALLKTLEEPPAHVKFIFATTETHKVPVTILSRCQRFDFKRIPAALIVSHLERIAAAEGIEIGRSGLAQIAREAEGSMRDAESLLDQVVSFAGLRVTDGQVTDVLGIVDRAVISETCRAVIEGSAGTCIEIVARIFDYGLDLKVFYRVLMEQFRNLLVSLILPEDRLLDLAEEERKETRQLAERAGLDKLQVMLGFMIAREEDLRFASHPRTVLEALLIRMCRLGDVLSFETLLERIESLEERLAGTARAQGTPPPGASHASPPEPLSGDSSPEAEAAGGERDWNGFLQHLSTRNSRMHNVLKAWQFGDLTDRTLHLLKGGPQFSASYFADRDHLEQLSGHCRDYFGRDLRIQIREAAPAVVSESAPPASTPEVSKPVQDLLHMFRGRIDDSDS